MTWQQVVGAGLAEGAIGHGGGAVLWWVVAGSAGAVAVAGLALGLRRVQRRVRGVRRVRLVLGAVDDRARERLLARARRMREQGPSWLTADLVVLPIGLVLGRLAASPVPVLGAALSVVPLRRWRKRRRAAVEAKRRASAVIELCAGLAAELRSGATAEQALHSVTSRAGRALARDLGPEAAARLAAGRYGGDVPAALRLAAELPGGRGAAAVAACWQIAAESGAGLATGLDQVADALRAERALAEEIAGELAGPRTTIAVLAALPLIGTALGAGLGAQPVRVLLHTPQGLVCLVGGVLFEALGVVWTGRIVRAAEAPSQPRGTTERTAASPPVGAAAAGVAGSGCGLSRVRTAGGGWEARERRPPADVLMRAVPSTAPRARRGARRWWGSWGRGHGWLGPVG
ncbi:hypothetical protein GCM10010440_00540 [Kitasatospora cinereorecta]